MYLYTNTNTGCTVWQISYYESVFWTYTDICHRHRHNAQLPNMFALICNNKIKQYIIILCVRLGVFVL